MLDGVLLDRMPAKDRARRRAQPQQLRARQTVAAILDAAEEVVGKVGYERATTNRIAARAGVNVALLYRYFAGKEALVGALIERAVAVTEDAIEGAIVGSATESLRPALRRVLAAAAAHPPPGVHRVLVERIDAARRRPMLDALRARLAARLEAFLAARKSELRTLRDREATHFVVLHLMESGAHAIAFYRPPDMSVDRGLDALTDVVARALEA